MSTVRSIEEYVGKLALDYIKAEYSAQEELRQLKESGRVLCTCVDTESSTRLFYHPQCHKCKMLHDRDNMIDCRICEEYYCTCHCINEDTNCIECENEGCEYNESEYYCNNCLANDPGMRKLCINCRN